MSNQKHSTTRKVRAGKTSIGMAKTRNPSSSHQLEDVKPPLPVEVVDMTSFCRLALALTDGSQILWYFNLNSTKVLAFFTAYMYWNGDLPILAYVATNEEPSAFLAYKSDSTKGEEWMFTDDVDDTKFKYASFIEVKEAPRAFLESLKGNYPSPPEPLLTEVASMNSMMRILLPLSLREGTVFPLWHFQRAKSHIIGTCIPFEHYYDSDALPVFFYVSQTTPPVAPFVKYAAMKGSGEKVEYTTSTADAKYFYAKIVNVKNLPFFPDNPNPSR